MVDPTTLADFRRLFRGRTDAYGTGKGQWIKQEPIGAVFAEHIEGKGHGLGIAPLLDDGRVWFAAVDLDEPDFEAAEELRRFLAFGGEPWIERSRSGNAHVWCFFASPIEAWIPRGIMREATAALGKPTVEIFPKQDKLLPGMVGNYINLPYHGDERPILSYTTGLGLQPISLRFFVDHACGLVNLCNPVAWRKRADWLMIAPPEQRTSERAEHGTGKELHMCAEWIIANRDQNPVVEGHRNVVYFNLAKQLLHYEGFGDDEAWDMLCLVEDAAVEQGIDRFPRRELKRIFENAVRGGFTSTGCDDPLMQPYVHPDCQIARGR